MKSKTRLKGISKVFGELRKSKNHVFWNQFSQDIKPVQQKGRRISIHLREGVETELNKLKDQNHITPLDKSTDKQLISPIAIGIKKDQTVKLALETKEKSFEHKNKYQVPTIELFLDKTAQIIKTDSN